MLTLKYETTPPNFYKIILNTEIKVDTAIDLNRFYNHINVRLNAVIKLQEDLHTAYHKTKKYSTFIENFVQYRYIISTLGTIRHTHTCVNLFCSL